MFLLEGISIFWRSPEKSFRIVQWAGIFLRVRVVNYKTISVYIHEEKNRNRMEIAECKLYHIVLLLLIYEFIRP